MEGGSWPFPAVHRMIPTEASDGSPGSLNFEGINSSILDVG